MSNHLLHLTTALAHLDSAHAREGATLAAPTKRVELARASMKLASPIVQAVLLVTSVLLVPVRAHAGTDVKSDLAAIWNDPTFQKQFVGAYGINADV